MDLREIREAISAANASWEAGQTSIAGRIVSGDQQGLGLSLSEPERVRLMEAAKVASFMVTEEAPPKEIDWRDVNGRNWVTPIKDQSTCGSCVAFATVAAMESRLLIAADDTSEGVDLSEAHLFFCGAGRACSKGWNFEPALEHCRDIGVGIEAAFPYQPIDQACKEIPALAFVRNGWSTPTRQRDRQRAVATNGPVIAGLRVFEDFTYYQSGIYRHVAGDFLGLHAVCVVGYSDPDRCWIVKNSWGSGWGEQGFFRIGYGECGIDAEFPFYDPEVYHV